MSRDGFLVTPSPSFGKSFQKKDFLLPSGDLVPSQWWDWAEWKYGLGENVIQVKLWTKWKYGIIENTGLVKFGVNIFKVNIFQGVNISRGEYFSGVNIFHRWISLRSEYFFRLSFAQWNIGYSHAKLLEGKGSKKICEKAVMCLEVVTNPGFF